MKRRKRKNKCLKRVLQVLGTILLVLVLSVLIFTCIFAAYIKTDLSRQVDLSVENFSLNQTSIIYYQDRTTGQWNELQKLYGRENRIWVSYEELPKNLIYSAIAIEDKRFLEHDGVDWVTTMKASLRLFMGENGGGGSTITQQLIKNLTGDQEITVRRKIAEIFRALEFERTHSKEEVLEWYLNVIYLGEGSYGVRSAAQTYFGKDVSELTLAECASLISITNNPSLFDPYVNPENNRERQLLVLQELLDQGFIEQAEYEEAVSQEMIFTRGVAEENHDSDRYYSYFVDEVVRQVIEDLSEQYGCSSAIAEKMLYCSGYSIYCTMDPDVQNAMESVYENTENIPKTTSSQQLQSAMVIIDNKTGDIAGIVGGVGDKGGSLTLSRATQSTLSPGSSIKPISVYGPALDLGIITPASVVDDTPYSFSDGRGYPKNTGNTYKGLVSVNYAVGQSLNTVAVKLVDRMTPEYCYTFAKEKMGLSTLVADQEIGGKTYTDAAIAPMAMGGLTKGVTVKDMTNAYAAIANDGYYRTARVYTSVLDSRGNSVLEKKQESHAALKTTAAWYMTDMLHNATLTGTSTQAKLDGMDVAGKTGTTTSDHDRWFAGFTPYYTGVVWCGFDEPEEVILSGSSTNPSLALWKAVMQDIHKDLEPKTFVTPENVVSCSVCADSGLLATEACRLDPRGSRVTTVRLFRSDCPTSYCDTHELVDVCVLTEKPATEYCAMEEENIKKIGLLNLNRAFPVEGIRIGDQGYVMPLAEDSIPEGYYLPTVGSTPDYNSYCTEHTEPPVPDDSEEEPAASVTNENTDGQDTAASAAVGAEPLTETGE